jgi:hypothetical protein
MAYGYLDGLQVRDCGALLLMPKDLEEIYEIRSLLSARGVPQQICRPVPPLKTISLSRIICWLILAGTVVACFITWKGW